MLLLAFDTSTSAVSVALRDEAGQLASSHVVDAQAHGEILAPGMRAVFAEAGRRPDELTHVVVGVGPGPFTGLRVGIVSALTLAHALDLSAHGVCGLDVLAHRAWSAGVRERILVAIDARRKEVYWAAYTLTGEGFTADDEPQVARAADLPEEVRHLPNIGRGGLLYPDELPVRLIRCEDVLDVEAGDVADLAVRLLGQGRDLLPPEPLYLRRPDAVPSQSVKSVLAR
ncbi:tRNA (adenosine(37)-N6)-threonylcarbamoyltransferase complex dimerization subunit type 1 TsaB [Mobilicoccus caccae]|uniref:tRNA (Adenosine(37)-N6)-threonylcarbamoyltransferase complex dimerization subunit type 1 TsaB n=1 Tax=Mobilicoccus caccae TaxID=1859295 RepID=A0ABQ6ITE7_9MICO|nr:tRNA (adenosine(37)-N6)-threonylcarbamoyltransferase complex dimerization subunit type 1 TsaB [Mobilicoccus caccae]GMA40650.1 tRNA (adenosine(37)-N6)-threonylcarbamoyltransferase complex dimerization subunit type 1 TsaB [Mobilicoccus caccae]